MSLLSEIRKPFNLFTTLVAIISISLSIMFYINGKKSINITYQISNASIIYDSKNATSSIKVYQQDTVLIKENVYLLTGKMWNSGDLPVEKNSIRKELSLDLEGAIKILDYRIVKQTDSSISQFKLDTADGMSIKIGWKYFDPNSGFSFQIICTGDTIPNFKIGGKVVGIKEIKNVPPHEEVTILGKLFSYFLGPLFIIFMIYWAWSISKEVNRDIELNSKREVFFLKMAEWFVFLAVIVYIIFYLIISYNLIFPNNLAPI